MSEESPMGITRREFVELAGLAGAACGLGGVASAGAARIGPKIQYKYERMTGKRFVGQSRE